MIWYDNDNNIDNVKQIATPPLSIAQFRFKTKYNVLPHLTHLGSGEYLRGRAGKGDLGRMQDRDYNLYKIIT